MKTDNKVLACVDQSLFAEAIADCAAWAAGRLDAPLEFLHIIDRHPEIGDSDDHSGAIGFDAQQQLLDELGARDAEHTRRAREQGRLFLNRLRERAIAAGIAAPDMRQRYGELGETLVEQEGDVRVFVLPRPCDSTADDSSELAREIEHVVRALHKPVLTVPGSFRQPERFMIAFDGGITTRRGVEMLAASPLLKGIPCYILMSGKPQKEGNMLVEWAASKLRGSGFDVTSEIAHGNAEEIVARAVDERRVDLLVMGAYTHSPIRSLLFGSRTSDLLRRVELPTLLLR